MSCTGRLVSFACPFSDFFVILCFFPFAAFSLPPVNVVIHCSLPVGSQVSYDSPAGQVGSVVYILIPPSGIASAPSVFGWQPFDHRELFHLFPTFSLVLDENAQCATVSQE
jgi:hypothetical protein